MKYSTLYLALPVALALSASAGTTPERCSLTPGFHPRLENGGTVMLAIPTADTLRAGAGTLRLGEGGGHSGPGRREVIYGQRFQVFRSTLERYGLIDDTIHAVLVPWDYDAGCEPVPWSRSAHWLSSTDTLLVSATRRDTAHWAGGIPTYDVTAVPQSVYDGRHQPNQYTWVKVDTTVPLNTPQELLEMLTRLPRSADLLTGDERVLDAIHAWALTHPEIAERNPSSEMIANARRRVRVAQLMSQTVPFTGTWELKIRTRSGREVTHWLRTMERPTGASGYEPEGPSGFGLAFNLASTEDELPAVRQYIGNWGFTIASRSPDRERHWRFRIEPEEFRNLAALQPELDSLRAERVESWRERWIVGEREPMLGEIALTSDGGALLRIAWDTDDDGKDDLVVTGRLVSRVTLEEPPEARGFQRW